MKRGDIELSESLPLGNGDNAWSCQCRDHSPVPGNLAEVTELYSHQQKVGNELQ